MSMFNVIIAAAIKAQSDAGLHYYIRSYAQPLDLLFKVRISSMK